MSFIWTWIWEKLSGIIQITAQSEVVGRAEVDNQVGEKVVRNRRKVSPKKGDSGTKPARIRSDNTGKTSRKSAGKTVRATTTKSKSKSKTIPKD
jgi:hypothetical protein